MHYITHITTDSQFHLLYNILLQLKPFSAGSRIYMTAMPYVNEADPVSTPNRFSMTLSFSQLTDFHAFSVIADDYHTL